MDFLKKKAQITKILYFGLTGRENTMDQNVTNKSTCWELFSFYTFSAHRNI